MYFDAVVVEDFFTFIQIGSGHTVMILQDHNSLVLLLTKHFRL